MRPINALITSLLVLWLGGATAASAPVHQYQLDNGLQIVVREDHRAPVVVSMVWYKVGSSYEHRGITGVSHVLEHMMFQGTEELEAGEFSRIIAAQGGKDNAFTSRDYTGYYQQLAADRLEVAFRLEAERMHQLRLSEEEFAKEVQVVMEERRLRVEDKPQALFGEHFMFTAQPVSPYRIPVIGWMEDLRQLELADLQAWYERWYSPGNAILVVVGDVQPESVLALAKKYFGPVPAREVKPPRMPADVPAPGERRLHMRMEAAEVPQLLMAYHVPSLATAAEPWKAYALEVLSAVLDGGSGARLPERLVRGQEIAASIGASYSGAARLDTLFWLSGRPTPQHTPQDLEQALRAEVQDLQAELVDAETLERAKNQLIADYLFQLDSTFYQAMQIGVLETTGIGWQELDRYEERVRAVTAEQVQAVAREYLQPERLAVGVLEPAKATR